MNKNAVRIGAIDVLRALTMFLMIFVNDLWSLKGIPEWLEHVPRDADGMGLADTVFPGFLFIVGMSVPFAIRNRQLRGEDKLQITVHIAGRALALLIMGVYLVNGEYINEAASGIGRGWWNVMACTGFILIWNQYPKTWSRALTTALKIVGALALLVIAFRYRGGSGDNISHFSTWWWGILGLIGWAYLVCALLFTWCDGKMIPLLIGWIISIGLCAANHSGLLPAEGLARQLISPVGEGAMTAFTIGGAIASQVFWKEMNQPVVKFSRLLTGFAAAACLLLALGFITRPEWGISKIRATPSWVLICSAIMLLLFLVIYWLVDIKKKSDWFSLIKPAGIETLLCYLVPYYLYAVVAITHWSLPEPVLTGFAGIIKSLLFSLFVIVLAGWLSKRFIRLRL
jgi:heparan-alpha-glucosaminide N-acetyltransferase